jgi:hypothetical protein
LYFDFLLRSSFVSVFVFVQLTYWYLPQSSGIAVGQAAFQFFTQTMAGQAVFST